MANKNNTNTIIAGAAALAGLLGTLTAYLIPRREKGWADQAKEIAQELINSRREKIVNRHHVLGGLAGGLMGVATALLLAPKSGSELREDITRSWPAMMYKQQYATGHATPKAASKRRRGQAIIRHRAAAKAIQRRPSKKTFSRSKSKSKMTR